jgi:hypothetical protein
MYTAAICEDVGLLAQTTEALRTCKSRKRVGGEASVQWPIRNHITKHTDDVVL